MRVGLEFRILGPLEVLAGTQRVPLNASKQRILLTTLLLRSNNVTGVDSLAESIWGDTLPRNWRATLQTYVQRLRHALDDPERVVTRSDGYQLIVADGELDLTRFRALCRRARKTESLMRRSVLLREALGEWRGPALADLPSDLIQTVAAPRLEEERLDVLEQLFEIDLRLGQHGDTIRELQEIAEAHRFRERFQGQLMLALYRSGRQADAIAVYHRLKEALADELGIDPHSELQALYQQILTEDPRLAIRTEGNGAVLRATPERVPSEVPADIGDLVGRDPVTKEILDILGVRSPAVPVVVIGGPPGVGKTALAVHAAHEVADQYPDGQLYINLRGYAIAPPLRPPEVLARFLFSLGLPVDRLPAGEDELVALYRTVLADRRVLIVLDNADSPGQVRPMLPNAAGCGVLVTSRNELRGLTALQGARLIKLDLLSDVDAQMVLSRMIGEFRVAAEPLAAAELVALCGRLPLALRISAANLVSRQDLPLATYVDELRMGNRLAFMEIDGDDEAAVRAAFRLSYLRLSHDRARVFRFLGLIPGQDFTVDVVAAHTGLPPEQAKVLLDQLSAANLVVADGLRYQLHDLLRLYAAERCALDDSELSVVQARKRLFAYYLDHVEAAAEKLYPMWLRLPRPAELECGGPVSFADSDAAMAWMDRECVNVLAAVTSAATDGFASAAWCLAEVLRPYLVTSGRYRAEGLAACELALWSAHAAGDLAAQAAVHNTIAAVHRRHGELAAAVDQFNKELRAHQASGSIAGQARALISLGNVHKESGRHDESAEKIRAGLRLAADAGNLRMLCFGWLNLSYVEMLRGDLRQAERAARESLALCDRGTEPASEGDARGILGEILLCRGCYPAAIEEFTKAVDLLRRGSVRHFEANVLGHLAQAYRLAGDLPAAMEHGRLAVRIAQDAGVRDDECDAMIAVAATHHQLGECDRADPMFRAALALSREIGYPRGQIAALIEHADCAQARGALELASQQARAALALSSSTGMRIRNGQASTALAHIELELGDTGSAIVHAQRAVSIGQDTDAQLDQVRALHVLGRAQEAAGDHEAARACRWQALHLLTRHAC